MGAVRDRRAVECEVALDHERTRNRKEVRLGASPRKRIGRLGLKEVAIDDEAHRRNPRPVILRPEAHRPLAFDRHGRLQ
jgi:hypothetical protein